MKLFNSLTSLKSNFVPISSGQVTMYTCGPTVYHDTSIGNFRTYTIADILHRTLLWADYNVKYIMNITDVGHLTGDNLGDSSQGEDRLLVASKRENKSAEEIANYYYKNFVSDYMELRLLPPLKWVKATEHINEQINLIKNLEEKGYTYKTSDGIYFDTKKFPEYGQLSDLDKIKEGARVALNQEKKDQHDFAVWKFSIGQDKRQQEWDSPWGIGFPGWHIECSAMSMKYLGDTIDIHLGGEDLKSTHHPNEIAQSEALTGKKFVNYWVHVSFLLADGGKMGKSLGNAYCLTDVKEKGFKAEDLKYFYLNAHYRSNLNFTWEALSASSNSLQKLKKFIVLNLDQYNKTEIDKKNHLVQKMIDSLFDDLNTPKFLAEFWKTYDGNFSTQDKILIVKTFNQIIDLGLSDIKIKKLDEDIAKLLVDRENARNKKDWKRADDIRKNIESLGFLVEDKQDKIILENNGDYFIFNK